MSTNNTNNHITQSTDDHRESVFLLQRLSVLIQCYNAVAVLGTFSPQEILMIKSYNNKNNNNNNNTSASG